MPLQHNAPVSQLRPIIAETEPKVIAVGAEYLDLAVESALESTSLRRLLVFDYEQGADDQRESLERAQARLSDAGMAVTVETLSDVIERGRALPQEPAVHRRQRRPARDDHVHLRKHRRTEGRHVHGADGLRAVDVDGSPRRPMCPCSTSTSCRSITWAGGYRWCRRSLSAAQAISFPSPIFRRCSRTGRWCGRPNWRWCRGWSTCSSSGTAAPSTDSSPTASAVADAEAAAAAELREEVLGGRVIGGFVGTAPLAAEMKMFIDEVLDAHIADGYGTTEVGAVDQGRGGDHARRSSTTSSSTSPSSAISSPTSPIRGVNCWSRPRR